jgi:hypothetical protein
MYEDERVTLTVGDFAAAGVEAPRWNEEPIPSLETWRRWRAAEDQALAHRHIIAREQSGKR